MLRYHNRNRRVPVAVGTILYIADRRDREAIAAGLARYCNPWQVIGWKPREVGAARVENGKYVNRYMAGGHLCIVRSLRNGQVRTVADWLVKDEA